MRFRFLAPQLLVFALLCCFAIAKPSTGVISVGMKQKEVFKMLKSNGAVEVAKDATLKGWEVAGRHECLFLTFRSDVLASIGVEENDDQPKAYRHWRDAKTYYLR